MGNRGVRKGSIHSGKLYAFRKPKKLYTAWYLVAWLDLFGGCWTPKSSPSEDDEEECCVASTSDFVMVII